MEKIYRNYDEKFVAGVVLYLKAADSILYKESAYTNKVSKTELINLFKKGLVIVNDGTDLVRPTSLTISTNYAAVSHTTVGASDKAVKTSFYSDGYTG